MIVTLLSVLCGITEKTQMSSLVSTQSALAALIFVIIIIITWQSLCLPTSHSHLPFGQPLSCGEDSLLSIQGPQEALTQSLIRARLTPLLSVAGSGVDR